MFVYEVTLEVQTALFRQEVKTLVASQQIVHELRDPDKQRRVGYRFVAVRGPIRVAEGTLDVERLVLIEIAESKAIATGTAPTRDERQLKTHVIVQGYRSDEPGKGYDNCMRELEALGYAPHEADDLLHPIAKRTPA